MRLFVYIRRFFKLFGLALGIFGDLGLVQGLWVGDPLLVAGGILVIVCGLGFVLGGAGASQTRQPFNKANYPNCAQRAHRYTSACPFLFSPKTSKISS
jgi:hypothetical protein